MSLPTWAMFVKDGVYVGMGSCNIGWHFHSTGIHRCIRDAAIMASKFHTDRESLSDEEFDHRWGRGAHYFGTYEQLRDSDFVIIYEYKILGSILNKIWRDELDAKGLGQLIDSGQVPTITQEEQEEILAATKSIRDWPDE